MEQYPPAGRELDAMVAARVMGCKVIPPSHGDESYSCGCDPVQVPGSTSPYPPHDVVYEDGPGYLKEYSKNLVAAIEVAERFPGYALIKAAFVQLDYNIKPGQFQISVWHRVGHRPCVTIADTAPVGICWAALKAVSC